jgi:tetratricopeptide (TPR) repeat protein
MKHGLGSSRSDPNACPSFVNAAFVVAAGLALLAGCAQVPPAPEIDTRPVSPSLHDEELSRAIAKHKQLAAQHRQSGDLASAATQLQIVALLAPHDEASRQELTAVESSINRQVQERMAAGNAALGKGDVDRAADEMLKVLALDPDNSDAAKTLREVEKRRQSKIQAGRAARVNAAANTSASRPASAPAPAAASTNGFDLELPLEIFKAGDTATGLRDLKRYVDANPNDRAGRQRIGTVVYDRARELEDKGSREQALTLYEQAIALRGEATAGWNTRVQALRKTLGDEHFQKGVRAYPSDAALAIKEWETSLRFDPQNTKAAARLKDAQEKKR